MNRGAWQATVHKVPKSRTQLSIHAFMHLFIGHAHFEPQCSKTPPTKNVIPPTKTFICQAYIQKNNNNFYYNLNFIM